MSKTQAIAKGTWCFVETFMLADLPALGIAEESPQRRDGARTCNGKPDPLWVTPK